MYLCDVCCAGGFFVLLFLVQRHASVFVQVWRETLIVDTFLRTRGKRISTKLSPPAQGSTDEQRSYRRRTGVVEPHVALTYVPGFAWIVLREDCIARRPFGPEGDQGLIFRSRDSLSALEPSEPGPTYIRQFRN